MLWITLGTLFATVRGGDAHQFTERLFFEHDRYLESALREHDFFQIDHFCSYRYREWPTTGGDADCFQVETSNLSATPP